MHCNRWPNPLVAHVGIRAADGMAPEAIAAQLGQGLTAGEVLAMFDAFGFAPPVVLPGHERVTIMMASRHRTWLAAEALRRGMEFPDLASAVLVKVAEDGLFGAVLEG